MAIIVALVIWVVITALIVFGIALFKTKWLYTIRFVSTAMFFFLIGITLIVWLENQELWILIVGIAFAFLNYFSILSWPKTKPKIMAALKLRW
jgi:hypothetical protein